MILWLVACGGSTADTECDEATPCAGFNEVCTNGQCEAEACATSAQCPIESWCEEGACTPGCTSDDDCKPGDECDTEARTCQSAGCTSTNLDCGYRQWCDEATGECYDAGDQYCRPCTSDEQCGDGARCVDGAYCSVDCGTTFECPADFECYAFQYNDGSIFWGCYTQCGLYEGVEPGGDLDRILTEILEDRR